MTKSMELPGYMPADDLPPDAAERPIDALNDDDVPGLTVDDALAITKMLEENSPKPSITEGWEERARATETGRVYKMETDPGAVPVLGGAAVHDVEIDLYSRDMPVRFKHTLGGAALPLLYQQRPRYR